MAWPSTPLDAAVNQLIASFWRALVYCFHPRVVVLSLLPVVFLMASTAALAALFWQDAVTALGGLLEPSVILKTVWAWLDAVGLASVKTMLTPLLLIVVLTPLMVVVTLLGVSQLMTPALVKLVALQRFPQLERRHGASFGASLVWALACSLMALAAMVVSVPMWIVPPLVLVLPPLIWGWLTARIMAFDALADHASAQERRSLLHEYRNVLLLMGFLVGLLGAAPSLLWSVGLMAIAMAPLLVPLSIWIYSLIFVFSSLWFIHFCLAALQDLRLQAPESDTDPATLVASSSHPTLSLS
jgi:hypothetical protein